MNWALFVAKRSVVQKLFCRKVEKVVFSGVWRGGRRLPLTRSFDSSHTNLIEAWEHQCWGAPKDRLAFHLFLIEIEHQKTWKIAHFWVPSKSCCLAHVAHRCLMDSAIRSMKMIMKDGPNQCWRVARILFAFHYVLKKSEQRDMCEKACFVVRPKSAFWPMSHSLRLIETAIRSMKMIMKDGPQQCWRVARIMFAFHYVLMKSEQHDMCERACFMVPPKSAFWHMSHTRAWWILRFEAYKLQRMFNRINVDVTDEEFLLFITFQWKASSATCVKKRVL